MRVGIKHRLFFALLAATGLVAVGILLIMQWSIDRGFLQYVNTLDQDRLERLAIELEQSYGELRSWAPLRDDPARLLGIMLRTRSDRQPGPEQPGRFERRMRRRLENCDSAGRGCNLNLASVGQFERRVVLLDDHRRILFAAGAPPANLNYIELRRERRTIGYLALIPRKVLADASQLRFVRDQQLVMALIAGLMLVISALLAFPLASRMVRPIRKLAAATRRLAAGDFAIRVAAERSDELGQLARDFNSLAITLGKNEQARRQWVADISHELRTPLAILRGEIEALQDGVRQANPQTIGSLHSETMRLGRLVDDLYQLALSDVGALTYRKTEESLVELLEQAIETTRPEFTRRSIALGFERTGAGEPMIFADAARLAQLFGNLLDNVLKYTDPGGKLDIRLATEGRWAVVHFMDSAPGVAPAELECLFERLYRVENSRNRETGGAGLGLSICRNIVEAHGGTITAQASPLGGVWITVRLPLEDAEQ